MLGPEINKLEKKIHEAAQNSLIFCTTGDNGASAKTSYPAGFKSPFKICSCAINGRPSANAESEQAEFYLPAENLDIKIPKYVNQSQQRVSGDSSAATAIAAGLAALILALVRFAYHSPDDEYPELETIDSNASDALSDYSDHLSPRRAPCNTEQKFAEFKQISIMDRVFKHMCCKSGKFVQPWEVLPMDLTDLSTDEAKKSLGDFFDRAREQ